MIALEEIRDLPFSEKLRMLEILWEGIAASEVDLDVPRWHQEILDERQALIEEGRAEFIDWESAKQQIRDTIS